MSAVIMMSKFVHEDMQKHKSTGLNLSEATSDTTFKTLARNPKSLKNLLVSVKIRRGKFSPQIVRPSMKKNRTSLLTMIKFMSAIVFFAVTC